MDCFNLKFSSDIQTVFYSKLTGKIRRIIMSSNIEKYIIDDHYKCSGVLEDYTENKYFPKQKKVSETAPGTYFREMSRETSRELSKESFVRIPKKIY